MLSTTNGLQSNRMGTFLFDELHTKTPRYVLTASTVVDRVRTPSSSHVGGLTLPGTPVANDACALVMEEIIALVI
jgi:hypothetical protein